MWTDGKGNDNVAINDEENAISVGDIKVENLVSVPEEACQFVTAQRGMPPVRGEKREFAASGAFDFGRKISELSFKSNGPAIGHRSSTAPSIASCSFGSIGSFSCSLMSLKSLAVALRAGTVAAKNMGSKGTFFAFPFDLASGLMRE